MSETLDALRFPLQGSRLIEASAGTGKTWTIAALYLRLVLGHGEEGQRFVRPLAPDEILVMTFTRAATRELSDRIRARLVDAVACFRGERPVAAHDTFLQQLLDSYATKREREAAAGLLALAAESMDDAAIFTIDAWCQRVLREHAFDSGCLFEETLEPDESLRLQEAVQDYWRQQCYPLPQDVLEQVQTVWKHLEALAGDMLSLHSIEVSEEELACDLGALVQDWHQQREQRLLALASGWAQHAQDYEIWLEGQNAQAKSEWQWAKMNAPQRAKWFAELRRWAADPVHTTLGLTETACFRLTPDGLLDARKNGDAIDWPQQAHAFAALMQGLDTLPQLKPQLRAHAAHHVRQRLAWLKQQASTFGFADMQQRLDAALNGENARVLRARILAQYPVALVDEFQDTSPLQYRLFDRIYCTADNDPGSALLLIGDPKQSIYGFRGADIYSYLQARQATRGRHYVLGTNYRSTHALVEAVNQWFLQAEQRPGNGAFDMRQWQGGVMDDRLPFAPVQAQGRTEQLVRAGQAMPAIDIAWYGDVNDDPVTTSQLLRPMARACAVQIVDWLNDETLGFARDGQPLERLRPRDIAVLVRSRKEAAAVRHELQRRGVASVYLSDQESVFVSAEAADLLLWLQAVAAPLDTRLVRAGLATRMLGKSLEELAALVADDEAFDLQTEQLRQLQSVWQRQGVLAMLRQTLHRFALPARWLADAQVGERRLTNFLHLAELLQNASAQLEGEQELIRWLAIQIEDPNGSADDQVVRLESDADLVKVVTVHKSKGLEYPVVCLPFAYDYFAGGNEKPLYVRVLQEDGLLHPKLDYSEEERRQADAERLREDLRLFYVALTRPRHLLWMGQTAFTKRNSKRCLNQQGASGYLLAGDAEQSPSGWYALLEALATRCPAVRLGRTLSASDQRLAARQVPPALAVPRAYEGSFDRTWSIGSFTALTRAMAQSNAAMLPQLAARPADDERSATDAADSTQRAILAAGAGRAAPDAAVWHRFMRGPVIGNLLHELLEVLADDDFSMDSPYQRQHLIDRCTRQGYGDQAEDAVAWLAAVVEHPLPPLQVPLQALTQRLTEMEFWLPMEQLPAAAVDVLCRHHLLPGQERPVLPQRSLHGMLMGFADLVFVHEGRYWVLDYKTNSLGYEGAAYSESAMAEAMLHHRYDVQAALYLLALHRLLRSRLGEGYDPAQQLGGALYFFVRGLDGPAGAVHHVPAVLALLDDLDVVLEGKTPAVLRDMEVTV